MAEISIAVCDDLESERISLARMIRAYARARALPVRVRLFSGGESLLAALAGSEPIHLLFLDIYMPGMSGVEAARRIRRAGSAVPIIFATYPLIAEIGCAHLIFNVVFFITIVSLLTQGTTLSYAARLLGLAEKQKTGDGGAE